MFDLRSSGIQCNVFFKNLSTAFSYYYIIYTITFRTLKTATKTHVNTIYLYPHSTSHQMYTLGLLMLWDGNH